MASGNFLSINIQPLSLRTPFPDFVEPYDETCPLCSKQLVDPYQTRCGHRLCKDCLTKHFDEHGDPTMCPFAEEDCEQISNKDGSVYPDFYLLKNLRAKKVYCEYKHRGCEETIPWIQLTRHLEKCVYGKEDCPYAAQGCKTRLAQADLENHVKTCPYKAVTCDLCHERDIAACLMQKHRDEACPNVEIDCIHECGLRYQRHAEQAHLVKCPKKPMRCTFARMGCKFEGSAARAEEHLAKESVFHLELVSKQCEELEKKMSDLQVSQNETVTEKDVAINTLEEQLRQNSSKLSRLENILRQTQKTVARQEEKHLQSSPEMNSGTVSLDSSSIQEQFRQLNQRLTTLDTYRTQTLTAIKGLEEQVKNQAMKYSEFDLRFQILETASYNGVLLWKISDYEQRKKDATRPGGVQSLYSQAFYTSRHGYRMCARVYLNGDGMGVGKNMSLFFVIMRGEFDPLLKWPFRQKVTLMLMDQTGRNRHIQDTFRPDPSSTSFQKPRTSMNIASGCPMFISHNVLEASDSPYLQENTIFIKFVVDIADLPTP